MPSLGARTRAFSPRAVVLLLSGDASLTVFTLAAAYPAGAGVGWARPQKGAGSARRDRRRGRVGLPDLLLGGFAGLCGLLLDGFGRGFSPLARLFDGLGALLATLGGGRPGGLLGGLRGLLGGLSRTRHLFRARDFLCSLLTLLLGR